MWLLNGGPLLLPQSMKYHICLFRPCFPFLNSINIYIAAKGLLQVAVIDEAAQLKWKSFFQSSFFGIYTVHAYYSASSKQYFFLPFLCISYIWCILFPIWLFQLLWLFRVNWLLKEKGGKVVKVHVYYTARLDISIWTEKEERNMWEEEVSVETSARHLRLRFFSPNVTLFIQICGGIPSRQFKFTHCGALLLERILVSQSVLLFC